MTPGDVRHLFVETFREWHRDKVPRLAAALAYYTIFSLAPLLVIAIAIAGIAFGREAVSGHVVEEIGGLIGDEGARAIEAMIRSATLSRPTLLATILSVATFLLGATGVLVELKDALNTVWNVEPQSVGVWQLVKERLSSFALVLGVGFLLLVSLLLSAAIAAVGTFVEGVGPALEWALQAANFVFSFAMTTLLFALIYKVLPDVRIEWSDVWLGAAITSLLFSIGRFLIGLYLGHSALTSVFGAAGSLAVILVWIYYSTQILFIGAEFTQVYAWSRGSLAVPCPRPKR